MNISSTFVGTTLKEYRTRITSRDTMNYAAAVDDNNPWYFDDERNGGIVAPPMFSVAVTWPLIENILEYLEADDFPAEVLPTIVHYTEHLEFHRPMSPGSTLTIKGTIAAILPRPAGTHFVLRFDAFDKNAAPVFTEHFGVMMRGVTCTDGGRGEDDLPFAPEDPDIREPLWQAKIHIDPLRPFTYDGCTRIFFPIHTSKQFAHMVGLPGIILQGTATLAYATRELINREAGMNPLALMALSCRFTGMVLPGTDITVELLEKDVREDGTRLFFRVLNEEGQNALRNGYALLTHE